MDACSSACGVTFSVNPLSSQKASSTSENYQTLLMQSQSAVLCIRIFVQCNFCSYPLSHSRGPAQCLH